MARLTGTTVVRDRDRGVPVVLLAGDLLPEWAEGQVGDHLLEVEPDVLTVVDPGDVHDPDDDPDGDEDQDSDEDQDDESGDQPDVAPPPKAGQGATTEAWAAYAELHGVEVPDGSGRGDIQELLTQRGVPTE